jgi:arabinose-5-phosphate isomerase
MLAFGDAVAVTISKLKGFSKNNFAVYHPAGALGKKLLMTTHSFMYKKNELPLLTVDTPFKDLLFSITNKKLGVGIVVDENEKLLGVITDGDLRRACSVGPDVFNFTAKQIMTANPRSISSKQLACNALDVMEQHNITSLVVTDNNAVAGLVHIHDLIKAGLKG